MSDRASLPPPPNRPQFLDRRGAAGLGSWWRGTWPFGRVVATLDFVEISLFPGASERLTRAELDAIEYEGGRGLQGPKIWLVPKSGLTSSLWFGVMDLQGLLTQLTMLGWPVRPRSPGGGRR